MRPEGPLSDDVLEPDDEWHRAAVGKPLARRVGTRGMRCLRRAVGDWDDDDAGAGTRDPQ
jgi:hypothetical protein